MRRGSRDILLGLALGGALLLGIGYLAVIGRGAGQPASPGGGPDLARTAEEVQQRLERRMPELRFNGVPLSAALDTMGKAAGVAIEVRWDVLAKAGVRMDRPVTMQLKDQKARKVLTVLIASAQQTVKGPERIDYEVAEDRVIVSTATDLMARKAATRKARDGK